MDIKQFRYYGDSQIGKLNYPTELSASILWSGKLFTDYVNGSIIKLGIQGRPNTIFSLNGGSPIYIGDTGIYEIDLEGVGTIQSITFNKDSLTQYDGAENVNSRLLIDIVYEGTGATV